MKNLYYDLQAELVKKYDTIIKIMWGENSEYIFFTTNGFVGWYIPKPFFLIDIDKLKAKSAPMHSIEKIASLYCDDDYIEAFVTGTKRWSKGNATILSDEKGEKEVWIDEKIFKKLPKECELKIKGELDCVRIYWHDAFSGVIMPIRHKQVDS